MIDQYLTHLRERNLSPATITARARILHRAHPDGDLPATTDNLHAWLDNQPVKPGTRASYLSHLAAFYQWAHLEHGWPDPTLRLTRPRTRRGLPRPLTAAQVAHAIDTAKSPRLRALVTVAANTGLRCAELAALEWSDITSDPPAIHVRHGKGDKARIVPLPAIAARALEAGQLDVSTGWRWTSEVFNMSPAAVSHAIRRHLHANGIPASAHQLRHTYATLLYRASNDLRLTQELLGHASPSTTAVYTQLDTERARSIVEGMYGGS